MQSVDIQVLGTVSNWRQQGFGVWLATVVRTWGSAPRPVGSLMALRDDGQVIGSVSGGCIEEHLINQLRARELQSRTPVVLTYGATAEESRRFNLPCGGTLQILLEPIGEHSQIEQVAESIQRRQTIARTVDIHTGVVTLSPDWRGPEFTFDKNYLTALFGPRYRLIIVGAGQVSHYLADMASALDYHVIVCDPRDEYRGSWLLPHIEINTEMPDDLLITLGVDSRTAIVALTHDPKLDDMALLEALPSDAFYVGAIGSRRNTQVRKDRLMQYFEITQEQADRLHGPVGLDIGALTPPEIAISILAEMTAKRRGVELPPSRRVPTLRNQQLSESPGGDALEACPIQLQATQEAQQG